MVRPLNAEARSRPLEPPAREPVCYRAPVIDAARVGKVAKLSPASAYKPVADLERLGMLKEITGGKRGRTYIFEPYVKLFR